FNGSIRHQFRENKTAQVCAHGRSVGLQGHAGQEIVLAKVKPRSCKLPVVQRYHRTKPSIVLLTLDDADRTVTLEICKDQREGIVLKTIEKVQCIGNFADLKWESLSG